MKKSGSFRKNIIVIIKSKIWRRIQTLFKLPLLLIVLSGAAANSATMMARGTMKSLPAQFPRLYTKIKMVVPKDAGKNAFTLWKIYTIDKPFAHKCIGHSSDIWNTSWNFRECPELRINYVYLAIYDLHHNLCY
ncbi:hypothetical protein CEXT_11131 [Caerostris extrusa]|uniref:Uncharacterized protein n=1 Tax=Caerostris extrusa TaxID=172846 RepID=A0AAV4QF68_CAEEX|nr:hypothetical protein CEXT_11131 [Caerostris extrusa]